MVLVSMLRPSPSPQRSWPAGVHIAAALLCSLLTGLVVAAPVQAADPVLSVDPTAVQAGQQLTIRITGAQPNKPVQLVWTNWQGAYQFSSEPGIRTTDAQGNAQLTLPVTADLRPSPNYKMRAAVGSQWTTEAAFEILPSPGPGTWIEAGDNISRTFSRDDATLYAHLGATVSVSGTENATYPVLWKVVKRDALTCGADNCGVTFDDKTAQRTKVTFPLIGINQGLYTLEVCALYIGCDRLDASIKQGGRGECDEARRDAYLGQFCSAAFIEALKSGGYSWPSVGGVGVNSWGPYHACNIGNLPVGGITAGDCPRGRYQWPLGNEQTGAGGHSTPPYDERTRANAYAAIVAEAWNPNYIRAAGMNGVSFTSADMNLSGRYIGQVIGITGPYKWLGIDTAHSDFMPVDYAYTYVSPAELASGPGALPSCMQDGSQDAQLYGMYKDWWGLCHEGQDNPDCSRPGRRLPETGKCVPDWRNWQPGQPAAQYTGGPLPFRYLGCSGNGGVKTNADEVACGPPETHICTPDKARAQLNEEVTFTVVQAGVTPIEWLGELPGRSSYDVVPLRQDGGQIFKVRFTQLAGQRTVGIKHYVGSQLMLDLCGGVIIDPAGTPPGGECTPVTLKPATSSFSPSQAAAGSSVTVKCDFGRTGDSITPLINGALCSGLAFTGFTGTVANFNCTAPASAGTYTVACRLNNDTASSASLCPLTAPLGNLVVTGGAPPGGPSTCTINGQASSILTKSVGEVFNIPWDSAGAQTLESSGWSGPIDCGKGVEAYTTPYVCRGIFLKPGPVGVSSQWGDLYMREAGMATVTLTPKRADGTSGSACTIQVVGQSGGGGGDTTAPAVAITSPTSGATYTASTTPLALAGSTSDNLGVTQVIWATDRGQNGTATLGAGATSWSAAIPLSTGANSVTITARDAAGNTATDTLAVTYTSGTPPPTCANNWNSTNGGDYDKDGSGGACQCEHWDACGYYDGPFSPAPPESCSPNFSHTGTGCGTPPGPGPGPGPGPEPGPGPVPSYCTQPFAASAGWTPLTAKPTGSNVGVEAFGTSLGPQPSETKYYKIPIDRHLERLRIRFAELQEPYGANFEWQLYRGSALLGAAVAGVNAEMQLNRSGSDVGISADPDKGNYYLVIKNNGTSLHQFFLGWTSTPQSDPPLPPAECSGVGSPPPPPGRVWGRVWIDTDGGQVMEATEKYVRDPSITCNNVATKPRRVTIAINGPQHVTVKPTLCSPGGEFPYFDTAVNLPPGLYTITVTPPTDWEVTTGATKSITVVSGQADAAIQWVGIRPIPAPPGQGPPPPVEEAACEGEEIPYWRGNASSGIRISEPIEFSHPQEERTFCVSYGQTSDMVRIRAVDAKKTSKLKLTVTSPSGKIYAAHDMGRANVWAKADMSGTWKITLQNEQIAPQQRIRVFFLPRRRSSIP